MNSVLGEKIHVLAAARYVFAIYGRQKKRDTCLIGVFPTKSFCCKRWTTTYLSVGRWLTSPMEALLEGAVTWYLATMKFNS